MKRRRDGLEAYGEGRLSIPEATKKVDTIKSLIDQDMKAAALANKDAADANVASARMMQEATARAFMPRPDAKNLQPKDIDAAAVAKIVASLGPMEGGMMRAQAERDAGLGDLTQAASRAAAALNVMSGSATRTKDDFVGRTTNDLGQTVRNPSQAATEFKNTSLLRMIGTTEELWRATYDQLKAAAASDNPEFKQQVHEAIVDAGKRTPPKEFKLPGTGEAPIPTPAAGQFLGGGFKEELGAVSQNWSTDIAAGGSQAASEIGTSVASGAAGLGAGIVSGAQTAAGILAAAISGAAANVNVNVHQSSSPAAANTGHARLGGSV